MTRIQEEWKPIVGYEGVYEISSTARVKRILRAPGATAGKERKQFVKNSGYLFVSLNMGGARKSEYIHDLVAAAFIGVKPNGCYVNHIDGNKHNNHVSNLEYSTPSKNLDHAYQTGLRTTKLSPREIREIRRIHGTVSYQAIANRFGISQSTAIAICKRQTWAHVD